MFWGIVLGVLLPGLPVCPPWRFWPLAWAFWSLFLRRGQRRRQRLVGAGTSVWASPFWTPQGSAENCSWRGIERLTRGWPLRGWGPCTGRRCGGGYLSLFSDYLWQDRLLIERNFQLNWHFGFGGRLWVHGDDEEDRGAFEMAGRVPVGLNMTFDRPRFLEVFLEMAPVIFVIPETDVGVDVALGVRFFF